MWAGQDDTLRYKTRVLKPPGGGSSDIFGSSGQTSPRRIKNHNQSQLSSGFFGDSTNTGNTSPDSPRGNKPDGNPVTGAGYIENGNNGGSQNGSSASSINGDNRSTTDSSPASVTSKPVRGRVPPGGFSSGLW